jgi:hypothetical protein
MKFCVSSSGWKTCPAKGEPARPVARLATVADMPSAMGVALGLTPPRFRDYAAIRTGVSSRTWPRLRTTRTGTRKCAASRAHAADHR